MLKLSNKNYSITLAEAVDLLAECNERKHVEYLIERETRRPDDPDERFELVKEIFESGHPLMVKNDRVYPEKLARWAVHKELNLPPALSELIANYEAPDPDLAGYIKSDKIEHLILTIRMLDNDDGTTQDGSAAWKIWADRYPHMNKEKTRPVAVKRGIDGYTRRVKEAVKTIGFIFNRDK